MRYFTAALLMITSILGSGGCALADKDEAKSAEGRAMWVVRWDLTSPEKIKQAVKYAKDNNFNALVVQVRGRGDSYYNSKFEPRSEELANAPADFDPLAVYVEECRKAGLEIHAWLNTHLTWSAGAPPKSPDHIVNKRRDWLMRSDKDEMVSITPIPGGSIEGAYTCPSNPEVKEYVRGLYLEVAENYDVDGIHFDYVRYPSINYCYCSGCLSKFKAEMDKQLSPERIAALEAMNDRLAYTQSFPEKWDEFRRKQITDIVGQVYRRAKQIKPNIVVSAAVFSNSEDAYNNRFQDWKLWMKMGIIDVLFPMAYSQDTDTFGRHIEDAVTNAHGRHVYAGIGSWRIPVESAIEKVEKARELGAQGICLFAYGPAAKDGTDDTYLRTMKEAVLPEPASIPAREWIAK